VRRRGENEAVLVLGLEPSKKGELFCHGEVFFLLTRPLMGDLVVFRFGKFVVRKKRERRGRNPQTGDDLMLGERRVVTFRCSGVLREKLNGGG